VLYQAEPRPDNRPSLPDPPGTVNGQPPAAGTSGIRRASHAETAAARTPRACAIMAVQNAMPTAHRSPFDAVLLVSFGGPLGPDDIRPFLQNVLRARRIPPERIEEVAHHYELFGGISPLTGYTMEQAAALRQRLAARGHALPVYVGMRNWAPLLPDVLRQMAADGVRRAVGVLAAAHRSYSSCTQYKQNVLQANEELYAATGARVDVTYVNDWHVHDGFIAATADRVREARAQLPADLQDLARVVFTAHSIPTSMAGADTYQRHLHESVARVTETLGLRDWALTYQSRSGRPGDPWLEPDINDWIREQAQAGALPAVIISPIGFVCDHIEVLYDLDQEARETCETLGVPMARARAVNAHPDFVETLAEAVTLTVARYGTGRPLPLVNAEAPNAKEPPPPVRPAVS
jgi:protoporphyrin/coproporphyrin ferrochelatase